MNTTIKASEEPHVHKPKPSLLTLLRNLTFALAVASAFTGLIVYRYYDTFIAKPKKDQEFTKTKITISDTPTSSDQIIQNKSITNALTDLANINFDAKKSMNITPQIYPKLSVNENFLQKYNIFTSVPTLEDFYFISIKTTDYSYQAFTFEPNLSDLIYNFFLTTGAEILKTDSIETLNKLETYDLTTQSKLNELLQVLKTQNIDSAQLNNRLSNYLEKFAPQLTQTAIIKFPNSNPSNITSHALPGRLVSFSANDNYLTLITNPSIPNLYSEISNQAFLLNPDLTISKNLSNISGNVILAIPFDDNLIITTENISDPTLIYSITSSKKNQIPHSAHNSVFYILPNNKLLVFYNQNNITYFKLFDNNFTKETYNVSLHKSWPDFIKNIDQSVQDTLDILNSNE